MDEDKLKKENEINEEELNDVAGGRRRGISVKTCPNCGSSVYFLASDLTATCSACGTEVSR